jgi:DNA-binding NtrC family response regulator
MSVESPGPTSVTVLAVLPEDDLAEVRKIFRHTRWALRAAASLSQAAIQLREGDTGVVLCDAVLPDGSWLDVLDEAQKLPAPPPVLVASRQADDFLWTEVLGRGGYNLVETPFRADELCRLVSLAWRHWKQSGIAPGPRSISAGNP